MRLQKLLLGEHGVVELVDPDVAHFIATGQVIAVRADSYATDRVDHIEEIDAALLRGNDRLSVLATVQRSRLEMVVRGGHRRLVDLALSRLTQRARYEDHLAHVLAVGVLGEALVDLLILLRRHRWIDKVPEANRPVRRTRDKFGQVLLIFAPRQRHWFRVETDRVLIGHGLDVVNRAAVGVHASQNGDRFKLCDVPHEHHAVTVKCNRPIIQMIDGARDHISELRCLVLLDFDSAVARQ